MMPAVSGTGTGIFAGKLGQNGLKSSSASLFGMRIEHRCRNEGVPQKLLNLANVMAEFNHMRRERVSQNMRGHGRGNFSSFGRFGQNPCKTVPVQVRSFRPSCHGIQLQLGIREDVEIPPAKARFMQHILVKQSADLDKMVLKRRHQRPVQHGDPIFLALSPMHTNNQIVETEVLHA